MEAESSGGRARPRIVRGRSKTYKFNEFCLDLWLCVDVFGPLNLDWLPWDALLG